MMKLIRIKTVLIKWNNINEKSSKKLKAKQNFLFGFKIRCRIYVDIGQTVFAQFREVEHSVKISVCLFAFFSINSYVNFI